ncbi:hypothetical protein TGPRC2_294030 [Toxoplasma gondii TgCatPRC2]|uniref:Uncharacterized protein n=10 Tax=Toxoplasma gondii TaxID=5811 RepID=B9PY83_TOXGV|nr:hypothetical protein TGME49_294030 [Toxoplasma gondii ME49]EPR57592.1 hypothetical protein TGGT1_294030 [Toxoplasma gondii GT1]ESS29287.1 hypothetical protein TGVEG_294030 [Toxoplasma gondii VEG]KAF4646135.1 hypothetical protein TGRH88_019220 [Toxoplasma gondii]KFG35646.1 hypothetical protein TGP89_294030 [Toxoplasma gondii p89]KFH14340.1 hypothetical protein TGMAS_294030 [Toxoplasma gondii MAS]KYF39762.1 hypothetical protein TGARI_294030 [Toxoplasma gondii ARI]KYK65912.1 hypothetical pro|eukprot:XP_002370193.1 hypothetical protein TGME49_294030 [Toxoplasma gondii ME49]
MFSLPVAWHEPAVSVASCGRNAMLLNVTRIERTAKELDDESAGNREQHQRRSSRTGNGETDDKARKGKRGYFEERRQRRQERKRSREREENKDGTKWGQATSAAGEQG